MNWLDWLLVVIIVLTALKGLKAGFFAGAAGIVGLLGGIWAAINYHTLLADFLAAKWNWDQKIIDFLYTRLDKYSSPAQQSEGILDTIISREELLKTGWESMQAVAGGILNVLAFVLIVLVIYIVAGGVLRVASRTVAGTLFFPFDKLGGLILGLVKGAVIAVVILLVLLTLQAPLSMLTSDGGAGFLTLAIQRSSITPLLLDLIHILNLPVPVNKINMVHILYPAVSTLFITG